MDSQRPSLENVHFPIRLCLFTQRPSLLLSAALCLLVVGDRGSVRAEQNKYLPRGCRAPAAGSMLPNLLIDLFVWGPQQHITADACLSSVSGTTG